MGPSLPPGGGRGRRLSPAPPARERAPSRLQHDVGSLSNAQPELANRYHLAKVAEAAAVAVQVVPLA
jgi:hypothetical protein